MLAMSRRTKALNRAVILSLAALALAASALAQTSDRVLLVINDNSPFSTSIGEYYANHRAVPSKNICRVRAVTDEEIDRRTFDNDIARPIGTCLTTKGLVESIYYIVTTAGLPLKIDGTGGTIGDHASVDSELTLLYSDLKGSGPHTLAGPLTNPFFGKRGIAFEHPRFPIYLVTRLAAYDLSDVKAMIDRCKDTRNRGKFVIDLASSGDKKGEQWLRDAALALPADRVILDETARPLYGQADVIGFASWGSNDANRQRRATGFHWLPGAIVTEYVSTDGRTFQRPPDQWSPSGNWKDPAGMFVKSPQSLAADFLHEGAAGASGHVYEPYLAGTPRPDLLLPAYYSGRNLAESYYLSIRGLSWQNIVIGDPLCSLGKP
jgi:uncharacterized protein (TIGR03790 family)